MNCSDLWIPQWIVFFSANLKIIDFPKKKNGGFPVSKCSNQSIDHPFTVLAVQDIQGVDTEKLRTFGANCCGSWCFLPVGYAIFSQCDLSMFGQTHHWVLMCSDLQSFLQYGGCPAIGVTNHPHSHGIFSYKPSHWWFGCQFIFSHIWGFPEMEVPPIMVGL